MKNLKKPKKVSHFKRRLLRTLLKTRDLTSLIITYTFEDGSTKQQGINKEFLFNYRGKIKSNDQVLNDIYAISNDYGAKYFTL